MAHRRPPRPVIALVVLALLAGAGYAYWRTRPEAAPASELAVSGMLEAREYQVAPAMTGRVVAVPVKEGTRVVKGAVLARLDAAPLKLAVDQATQGVVAAQAAVTNAQEDLDDDDDDTGSTADLAAARARLKQAQAAVSLAKIQQGYATITAPANGTVITVSTNVGQNAAPGKTLLTLRDNADMWARVFVPETQVGAIRLGQHARLTTDASSSGSVGNGSGGTGGSGGSTGTASPSGWTGTVTYVSSASEFTPNSVETKEQRVKLVYEVRVKVTDTTGTLKAGLPVDVDLAAA